MPVHGAVYAGFNAANRSLATLGELAAQKDEQSFRQMQQQVSVANMRRLQEQADREAQQQQQDAQQQQQITALAQKHSQGGVFDQEGFLKDLQATGNLSAVEKATKILSDTNKVTFDSDKAKRDADKEQGLEVSAQFRDLLNLPDEQAAPLYQQYRSRLVTRHPTLAADIPETYDKTAVGHLVQAPLDHKDYVEGIDKADALAKDNASRILVRLALAKPDEIPGIFALAVKVGVPQQITDMGLTPESVAAMPPDQRRQLLYQAKGVTPDAILSDTRPKAAASGVNAGSFEDYVLRYATEKGKTPEQITTGEIEQLRKRYQQADDRPAVRVSLVGVSSGANPTTGWTPDGLELAATQYRLTGTPPQMGNGSGAAKQALINEAARQAKVLGSSPAATIQRQAAYKGDASALTQISKMASSAEAFETKAAGQADIIRSLSSKVDRTKFPILNNVLLSGKRDLLGDSNTTQFYNALETFTEEYAKIMAGATGSAAASSDSARAAAKRLINAGMSKGTINDVLDLMEREMALTIQGYDVVKQKLGGQMTGAPSSAPAGATTAKPVGRFNPATGKIDPVN